ncbi:arabinosylfuranosidase ArfA [Enterococcus entomosocium]|uniref:arabinosylfuranosidase ArfA n=1 Tax=Enterococcus entomosocium TaxID=3034352 RepID=UPI0026495C26|nr:alpha-N-arabinofuranosidase [Enterococcus entomosocium]
MKEKKGVATLKKTTMYLDKHFILAPVDERIYGSFVEHLGRCVYEGIYQPESPFADEQGFRQDVVTLIKQLNVPIVRYPGGNFVSGYKWEDSVGPKEQRPAKIDLAWRVIESNQFGLNEFMDWTKEVNTAPMMAINLGTRGIEAAKNLIEYTNLKGGSYYSDLRRTHGVADPHDIKLWCLGNEMDGPWQEGHKTADEYGRLAEEAGKAMRLVDPTIETVACGSSSLTMPTFGMWEDTVLSHCYDQVDYISMHQYYGNRNGDSQDYLASNVAMDQFISQVAAICDAVKAKRRSKKTINISFDEWNVWYHSNEQDQKIEPWSQHPPQLEDVYHFEDALLVASMMITMLHHADRVKIACMAQLVNVIAPIMTSDTAAWKQTIFYPYEMISNYGRGHVLHSILRGADFDSSHGKASYVDAIAIENEDDYLTFFLVNKDLQDANEFTCDLRQYDSLQIATHQVLHHPDLHAVNTEATPNNVMPVNGKTAELNDGILRVVLEKQSFQMLRLKKNVSK